MFLWRSLTPAAIAAAAAALTRAKSAGKPAGATAAKGDGNSSLGEIAKN